MSEDIKNQDEVTEASMAKPPVANKGVVTPDKDPVPKSLASVDKASDGTKPSAKRKGDQDKKDSPQKLKAGMQYNETENEEEVVVEDMTKMEALRKIIEELKGFDKEDIQSLVNEMMKKKDDEDEDESPRKPYASSVWSRGLVSRFTPCRSQSFSPHEYLRASIQPWSSAQP